MKLSDIITIADSQRLQILAMKNHEQLYYSCVLTALKERADILRIQDENGMILFYDERDSELVPMVQVPTMDAAPLLEQIMGLPSDTGMCELLNGVYRCSMITLFDEIIHCILCDCMANGASEKTNIALQCVFDACTVPRSAEGLLEMCKANGMFSNED